MAEFRRVLVLVIVFVFTGAFSSFQSRQTAPLILVPTDAPNVSLIAVGREGVNPLLDQQAANNQMADVRPYLAVISNQSSRRIKGLTVAWTVAARDGKTNTRYSSQNYYFIGTPQNAVVSAKSQLLLIPAIPPPQIAVPPRPVVEDLNNAVRVCVELDAVIFEDGTVWGPDRSRTIRNLELRHEAARDYSRRVRGAAQAGQDPAAVDAELAALSPGLQTEAAWPNQLEASLKERDADLLNFWRARIARAGRTGPMGPLGVADRIDSIAPLPRFFREAPPKSSTGRCSMT